MIAEMGIFYRQYKYTGPIIRSTRPRSTQIEILNRQYKYIGPVIGYLGFVFAAIALVSTVNVGVYCAQTSQLPSEITTLVRLIDHPTSRIMCRKQHVFH